MLLPNSVQTNRIQTIFCSSISNLKKTFKVMIFNLGEIQLHICMSDGLSAFLLFEMTALDGFLKPGEEI
jgi:hypothetical protein